MNDEAADRNQTAAMPSYDFAIVGAGIAGASVAAELSREASVVLLEMESQPGYHTTGRSAAVFAPIYGPAPIRALTRASAGFFLDPPAGFAQHDLLSMRPVMMIARDDQTDTLEAMLSEIDGELDVCRLNEAELRMHQPLLKPGYAQAGMVDGSGRDIDVHAVHQGYLRSFAANGGTLLTRARVEALTRQGDCWEIATTAGTVRSTVVLNAAGAWADEIGTLAGAENIGLVPKRRTALVTAAPDGIDIGQMPITIDIEEQFYLKPDAGRLLISPADETPSPPCDAQPEELDIAICVDRIETAFDLKVSRIENKWAGLRSFVADKCPVAGYSRQAENFFWLAGQGGYGIQTAPALARFAAQLALGKPAPADIVDEGLDPAAIAPERLIETDSLTGKEQPVAAGRMGSAT